MSSRVTTIMNGVPVDIMMMRKRPWLDEEDVRSFVKLNSNKANFSLEPARAYEFLGADPAGESKDKRIKLDERAKLHPQSFKHVEVGERSPRLFIDDTLAVRLVAKHCPDFLAELLESLYKKNRIENESRENNVMIFNIPTGSDSLLPIGHEMLSPLNFDLGCANGSPAAPGDDTPPQESIGGPTLSAESDDVSSEGGRF